MSQTIGSIIKQKLNKIEERKNEKPGDGAHALQALADYALYFQGAHEIAEALGGAQEDMQVIQGARELVDAEANAIERRLALMAALD